MMTQQQTQEEKFQTVLDELYREVSCDDALAKVRTKAWDRFIELGLPTRRSEVFKYVRLRNFVSKAYSSSPETDLSFEAVRPHIYPECTDSVFVFVNGVFCEKLSATKALPSNIVASSLKQAMRTFGGFLNNHWAKTLKEETDPFAVLNAATHKEGLFFYVPPNSAIETPIQILHVIDAENHSLMAVPRLQVFIGKGSQANIYSSLVRLSGEEYAVNQLTDFLIDEDAHATYTSVPLGHSAEAWHFDTLRATLKRNSTFKAINVNNGAATYRNDYHVTITQENCEAELDCVWMLADKRESHSNVVIDHQAPHCRSRQLFKGVLRDASRSSFEGKILVRQAAQKTDAFQLNNNLLLSDKAHADSKPNLEIFADDVKASHGATVGRLDEEQLFYLKSRGFSTTQAKNILIYGYAKEVIDRVSLPSLSEELRKRAEKYIA